MPLGLKEIGYQENNLAKFNPFVKEEIEPKPKSRLDFKDYLRSPRKIEPQPLVSPSFNDCGYSS